MAENARFSDVVQLIKSSPALLITTVVGVAVVLYIVYKSNSGAIVAPTGQSSTANPNASAGAPGYFLQYEQEVVNPPNITVNVPTTTTSNPTKNYQDPNRGIYAPDPWNTPGESNNFHFLTIGPGLDTLPLIAKYANGGKTTGSWNYSKVYNYRNNGQIFQSAGVINSPSIKLPHGLVISI